MGKKKVKSSTEDLLLSLLKIHVPNEYLRCFDLTEVKDKADCYELVLIEKETLIPNSLSHCSDIVLDGFCDPISIISHSFSMKKIYLIVKRRRWKVSGSNEHFSNSYDLHPAGAKLTRMLASFFKGGH